MAPFEVRVRRVMEQDRVDHKTATARVHTYHRDLCGRIDFLFGRDWTQPENYDFVLNTRDDAWQFYTDLLAAAARHPRYQPTPASRQKLHDLTLAAQVRAAIASEPVTKNLNVEVTAQADRVTLDRGRFQLGPAGRRCRGGSASAGRHDSHMRGRADPTGLQHGAQSCNAPRRSCSAGRSSWRAFQRKGAASPTGLPESAGSGAERSPVAQVVVGRKASGALAWQGQRSR